MTDDTRQQHRTGGEESAPIPLARPSIGDAEIAAAERALRSGRLVLGPENQRFEAALAERTGRAHAVAVASGTAALELGLWSLGIGAGDEVLVTAFGFAAAANAVARCGAVPVPVDVDSLTWNLDLESIRAALTARTRAIVSIDQLGLVAESAPLMRLAAEHGIPVIDDASCGLGGTDSAGVPGGGYGRLGTLSFHPRKLVTTGEGGAVVCDDPELAECLRQLRNHGQAGPGVFRRIGTNARLGEAAAAVGCVQLARLDDMLSERRALAAAYCERLASLRDAGTISWQVSTAGAKHAYQTFAIVLPDGCVREQVIRRLAARGIEVGAATYAFHRLDSFVGGGKPEAEQPAGTRRPAPISDELHERGLALPLFVGMRPAELDRVCDALSEVVA